VQQRVVAVVMGLLRLTLAEQHPAQCAKVVEDTATGRDMTIQLIQLELDQEQGIVPTIGRWGPGGREVLQDAGLRLM